IRAGKRLAAAAWGQGYLCVLGAFSLRWFWFPPVNELRWGGILAIAGMLMMMMSSWLWPIRARHDLEDTRLFAKRFQVSVLQAVVAVTLCAVAMAYWLVLEGQ
ncbi:MAG: hypothetical protein ACR2NZ_24530, partial [Rubripirellula sp.]